MRLRYFSLGVNSTVLFNYLFRNTPDDPYAQFARNFTDGANGLAAGGNGNLPSYELKPYVKMGLQGCPGLALGDLSAIGHRAGFAVRRAAGDQ